MHWRPGSAALGPAERAGFEGMLCDRDRKRKRDVKEFGRERKERVRKSRGRGAGVKGR